MEETLAEEVVEQQETSHEQWSAEWEITERVHHKTPRWYYTLGVITLLGAFDAYLLNNMLFATLVLLSGMVIAMATKTPSRPTTYKIDWRGLSINGESNHFNEFASFWITEHGGRDILLLAPKKTLGLQLIIPLGDAIDPYDIHTLLFRYIPEVEDSIPFSYTITEYLGF